MKLRTRVLRLPIILWIVVNLGISVSILDLKLCLGHDGHVDLFFDAGLRVESSSVKTSSADDYADHHHACTDITICGMQKDAVSKTQRLTDRQHHSFLIFLKNMPSTLNENFSHPASGFTETSPLHNLVSIRTVILLI